MAGSEEDIPLLHRIRLYAVKGDAVMQANVHGSLDGVADVWDEVEVPWSFFETCPPEKAAMLMPMADEHQKAVEALLRELAKKHRVYMSAPWYVIHVHALARKDFAGAARRIKRFLSEYDCD